MVAGRVMQLERSEVCHRCGMVLAVSIAAVWDGARKTVTCMPCATNGAPLPPEPPPEVAPREQVSAVLVRHLGDRAMLLTRRRLPGTRRSIDVVAVATSGVWLIVVDHHRPKVIHDLHWLADAAAGVVQQALDRADVPVTVALVLGESTEPLRIDGVWVADRSRVVTLIDAPGPLTTNDVLTVGMQLAVVLE